MQSPDYRPDIDGLRAVAVLAVVAFHYGFSFRGGFVGVDLFFVISGYLITKHLTARLSGGYSFGQVLAQFYNGRIRRILPALLVMLLMTLAAGWFLLLPGDYATTAESAAYSAIGAGNIFFFWNTGYFDQAAGLQPLLHMWSLGVEEQFYLVWPLLLPGIFWLTRGNRFLCSVMIAGIVLASLIYGLNLNQTDPTAAFYLPFSRAWEIAAGALVSFMPPIRHRVMAELAKLAGLGLIVYAAITLDGTASSFGIGVLPAVIGAMAIVWPAVQTGTAKALSIPPLRFTGLVSYSLYLWHWPVLVLFRHYDNGDIPTMGEAIALVLFAYLLAILSWRFVEPIRSVRLPPRVAIPAGVGAMLAAVALSSWVYASQGFPERLPPELRTMQSFDEMWRWDCPQQRDFPEIGGSFCVLGGDWETAKTKGFLWGDSQALHFAPGVDLLGRENGTAVILYHDCPAIIDNATVKQTYVGLPLYSEKCATGRAAAISFLNARPEVSKILLPALWAFLPNKLYSDALPEKSTANGLKLLEAGFAQLDRDITGADREIYLMADIPVWETNPISCRMAGQSIVARTACPVEIPYAQFQSMQGAEYAMIRDFVSSSPRFHGIFPADGLCDEMSCANTIGRNFIYSDKAHLRRNLPADTTRTLAETMGLGAIFQTTRQE